MNKTKKSRWGKRLRAGGIALVLAALLLTGYNVWDEKRAEKESLETVDKLAERLKELVFVQSNPDDIYIPDYVLNPNMDMPKTELDGNYYIGIVDIPVLGLELPVMKDWSYKNLRIAPCRYKGSAYTGDLIIAAHNYPSHFGLLKTLQQGDEVIFTDIDSNVFKYTVAELESVGGRDVEAMTSGDWDLTLFTCTLGGTERITVRCIAEEEPQSSADDSVG